MALTHHARQHHILDQDLLKQFIKLGLDEDLQGGDLTSLSTIKSESRTKARLLIKDEGVLCGLQVAQAVFTHLDPTSTIDVRIQDGETVKHGDEAFYIEANAQALLQGERLVLNTMQRLSGVSTMSRQFIDAVEGTGVTVLDTRKTTPLLRFLEKYAVVTGGCTNYRSSLNDWIMIKDNHIDAAGSIPLAIERVGEYLAQHQLKRNVTIEVRNLEEIKLVLQHGGTTVTRMMFDNFTPELMIEAVKLVGEQYETEASGGINLETIRAYAETGVDCISVGALTHSAGSLDMSLKVMD